MGKNWSQPVKNNDCQDQLKIPSIFLQKRHLNLKQFEKFASTKLLKNRLVRELFLEYKSTNKTLDP